METLPNSQLLEGDVPERLAFPDQVSLHLNDLRVIIQGTDVEVDVLPILLDQGIEVAVGGLPLQVAVLRVVASIAR